MKKLDIRAQNQGKTPKHDPEFHVARLALCSRFSNASEAYKSPTLKGFISRTRLYELFSTDIPDVYFPYKFQRTITTLIKSQTIEGVYDWISRSTSQNDPQKLKRYCGNYRYWRFFPTDGSPTIFAPRVGSIQIELVEGALLYRHRSANAKDPSAWEDEGFAFFFGQKMYTVGFREENIRLAIAHVPNRISKDKFHGIVLSKHDLTGRIFAANFIMYHETNADYENKTGISLDDFKNMTATEPMLAQRLMQD